MVGRTTQIVSGPSSELARGLSSDRIAGGRDPLVHYWRASPYAMSATTQPRSLCGRRIAFGRHTIRADAGVCWVCTLHSKRQSLVPLF